MRRGGRGALKDLIEYYPKPVSPSLEPDDQMTLSTQLVSRDGNHVTASRDVRSCNVTMPCSALELSCCGIGGHIVDSETFRDVTQ